jgi:hypothetical protein
VRRNEDYTTKVVSFGDIFDSDRYHFEPLQFVTPVQPFPYRGGILPLPEWMIERDAKWLNECQQYFSENPRVPPPCGDETLRPTMPSPGQQATYITLFAKVCDTQDSANCTVSNVFAVMIATPRAVAPVKNPDAHVEHCGVLALESFTNLGKPRDEQKPEDDNYIRVEIDDANQRIINSTMPGHVFWPGRVIRQIVLVDGKVGVRTTGYGNENFLLKWMVNVPTGGIVWTRADGFLREAYEEKYGE